MLLIASNISPLSEIHIAPTSRAQQDPNSVVRVLYVKMDLAGQVSPLTRLLQ